ncbi:DUF2815 family protein [Trueperella bernardiae]|uniref:DUF2815 family protein n=1 Tax=Trueperella bernardiae TaxID=59561 RepID=UPI002949AF11|nr:DUF2815 family protein [Trueperella bernardiae]MDV6238390.1 DUF2815 family protein [Trueperella bernardiae]
MSKVIVKDARLSYAHVWEPKLNNVSGKEQYSASLIIAKTHTATINAIKKAIKEAIEEGEQKFGAKWAASVKTPNFKIPLRDGDLERPDDAPYADSMFMNANANPSYPPQIVDQRVRPILDRNEVYSGCYANVSINFFPFDVSGSKGIAAGLGNIQKVRDGDPLGGGVSASAEFEVLDDVDGESGVDDFLA